MKIIQTDKVLPEDLKTQFERDQVYNGLDCCITAEVLDALLPQLDETTSATYNFSRSLQGPALEMRLRGVLVDQRRKNEVIDEYYDVLERLNRDLERIVFEGVGMSFFNWRSNADLQTLFYERLKIPIQRAAGRPTVNRKALEKMEQYLLARPIIAHIKAMRDLGKKIGMLRTEIDPDGRMRTSYNIAGTTTGRFSSSFSEFGTGTNLQNVTQSLKSIFIADKGMKLAKFDAKSGESFCVGANEWNLFTDGRYLDACETGDPHTQVTSLVWPRLGWTGNLKLDKKIAEQPFYRHLSYRDMSKKLGHGSNYGGKAATLSAEAQVPINIVQEFQPKYWRAFPAHLQWQASVERQLRRSGFIISLTGRKRWFFGRRNDEATLREAIAYDPQCSLADIVNRAMLAIWRSRIATLYMHDHDALTVQFPEEAEDEIIPRLLSLLAIPIPLSHDRTMLIPFDCKTGWNRADWSESNPYGLKDYIPSDKRRRPKEAGLLDRKLYKAHG